MRVCLLPLVKVDKGSNILLILRRQIRLLFERISSQCLEVYRMIFGDGDIAQGDVNSCLSQEH